ncbi:MAG TPA: hypothetical protein DCE07_00595 [Peptococcaceae bacterium]|nr:hypothetical protein [Peptococcaceae bacterium]
MAILAALSAANSGFYSCTRFLYSLSLQGVAPKFLARLNKRSVPFNSLVFTTAGIIFCIITGLIPALANTLNVWMWAVAGLIGVIVWILIGVCVIIFRVRLAREGRTHLNWLTVRLVIHGFPY